MQIEDIGPERFTPPVYCDISAMILMNNFAL